MAGNNIKGITIDIGGNTAPLNKALADVNKTSRNLQIELKQVDKLLKLDPTNTEALSQKQKILASSINETKTKLDTLKEAEKQVQKQFQNGEVSEEQYRAFKHRLYNRRKIQPRHSTKQIPRKFSRQRCGIKNRCRFRIRTIHRK